MAKTAASTRPANRRGKNFFSPAGAQQVLQNRVRLISFFASNELEKVETTEVNTKSGLIKSQVCDVIKASLNPRVSNIPFSFSLLSARLLTLGSKSAFLLWKD